MFYHMSVYIDKLGL